MDSPSCDRLDDFLAHDLAGAELGGFTGHLPACADCRDAIEAHQRLAARLKSAIDREPIPPSLAGRVERRIQTRRLSRRLIAAFALAASITLIAVHLGPVPPTDRPQSAPVVADTAAPRPARVHVGFPAGVIVAVPV